MKNDPVEELLRDARRELYLLRRSESDQRLATLLALENLNDSQKKRSRRRRKKKLHSNP